MKRSSISYVVFASIRAYLAGASPDLQATILHLPRPVTTSLFPSSLNVGFWRTNVQT